MDKITFDFTGERIIISKRSVDYLIEYICVNVLSAKNIIINDKYYWYFLFFITTPSRYGPQGIWVANLRKSGNGKSLLLMVPFDVIVSSDNQSVTFLMLLYKALGLFLQRQFKRISGEFLDEVWSKIDFEYIESIVVPLSADDTVNFHRPSEDADKYIIL
jgi:hypothetical protein